MAASIAVGKTFKDFEELRAAIEEYRKEQKVPYTVQSSKSASLFNKKNSSQGSTVRMDENLIWKEAVLACKHYGKPRFHKHVEGTKERPNQGTFKVFCKAKFNVLYSLSEGCFKITKIHEEHENHPLDETLAEHYPEFRAVPAEVQKDAEYLLQNEVKAHHIRSKVCSHGVKATRQDIQNIRNKWKRSLNGGASPEDKLYEQLEKLLEEDPGSVVVVNSDEKTNEIYSIFFQTRAMKEAFEKYPEVLIMDATYKLCLNDMPLVVFEVIDCFGSGRIAGYSIIKSEEKTIVSGALRLLCSGNDEAFKNMRVVLVDKDQSEIASIKEVAPHVQIHLCDYHVKNAFETAGKKNQGNEYKEKVHPVILSMIHAHTEEDFNKAYAELKKVGNDKLMKYYHKYWHNIDLVWSDYQRNSSFNLKERTTGRVECQNGKIKKVASTKLPVAEVVFRLRMMDTFKEMDLEYKMYLASAKTKYDKYCKDPIVQEIKRKNTPFVAGQLQKQYERSKQPPSNNPHDVTCNSCDCKFFSNTNLPCAHIFRCRSIVGEDVYDHSLIPSRWKVPPNIAPQADDKAEPHVKDIIFVESDKVKSAKTIKCLTSAEKYSECINIATNICMMISNTGGVQYQYNLNALKCFQKLLKEGKKFAVIQVDENHKSQGLIYPTEPDNEQDVNVNSEKPEASAKIVNSNQKVNLGNPNDTEQVVGSSDSEDSDDSNRGHKKPMETVIKKLSRGERPTLPKSVPVKGRPPANKRTGGWRTKKKVSSQGEDSGSEAADDVETGVIFKSGLCSSCLHPALLRTSFSKKNNNRKYYVCAKPLNEECKKFHTWAGDQPIHHLDTICEDGSDDSVIIIEENKIDSASFPVVKTEESVTGIPFDHSKLGMEDTIRSLDQSKGQKNLWQSEVESFEPVSAGWRLLVDGEDDDDQHLVDLPILNDPTTDLVPPPSSCPMCAQGHKPNQASAHKCAICRTPVHSFGCSIPRGSGEEGSGGNDLLCIPCYNQSKALSATSATALGHNIQPNEPENQYKCFTCKQPATKGIAVHKGGKHYYYCKNCGIFLFWAKVPKLLATRTSGSPLRNKQTNVNCVAKTGDEILSSRPISSYFATPVPNQGSNVGDNGNGGVLTDSCLSEQGGSENKDTSPGRPQRYQETPQMSPILGISTAKRPQRSKMNSTTRRPGEKDTTPNKLQQPQDAAFDKSPILGNSMKTQQLSKRRIPIFRNPPIYSNKIDDGPICESQAIATALSCIAPGKWLIKTNDGQRAVVTQKKNTCDPVCIAVEPACKHRFGCTCSHSPDCMHVRLVHGLHFPEEITPERRAWIDDQGLKPHVDKDLISVVQYVKPGNTAPPQRKCTNCYVDSPLPGHKCCQICKEKNIRRGHICQCIVCAEPIKEKKEPDSCFNCLRPVHEACSEMEAIPQKGNRVLFICRACKLQRDTGLSRLAYEDIQNNRDLTEEHLVLASRMLKQQYPHLAGLSPPINVFRMRNQIMLSLDVYQAGETYLQFIGTGTHWVLTIIHQDRVYLFDSLFHSEIHEEVQTQIASIINTSDRAIEVYIPSIQQQNNSVDCALYCIANAVEFAANEKIQDTTFDVLQMRNHWQQCILKGKLAPFPSTAQEEQPDELMQVKDIVVHCCCRLPEHFSANMVKCSANDCHTWYHCDCVQIDPDEAQGKWLCPACKVI